MNVKLMLFGCLLPFCAGIKLGVVSYWEVDDNPRANDALFNQIPNGSLAILNVESGILKERFPTSNVLVDNLAEYRRLASNLAARGVQTLGYVATGYFKHQFTKDGVAQTLPRIQAQVAAWFQNIPTLNGIFFDEAAPEADQNNCNNFVAEYAQYRRFVQMYKPGAIIAFNAGYGEDCAITASQPGEINVVFESPLAEYNKPGVQRDIVRVTAAAKAKGVKTWQMVHTVKRTDQMTTVVKKAKSLGADYVYVVDVGGDWQNGENTWGAPPPYFNLEKTAVLN